jgi:methyl-accepting chemotaxis protein
MLFKNSDEESKYILNALDKSQAIIHFRPDGTILWANNNFLNAVGYTAGEIQGKHHSIFVEPSYASSQDYKNFWQALGSGKFQAAEYKRFGKNGKEIWIQASYNPLIDKKGKVIKIVKYATDITEQTLLNADYKGQIEAIGKSQAVITFNLNGIISWANENFLNAVGYTLDEIKGKHHRMFVDSEFAQSGEYMDFWSSLARGEFQAAEYKRFGKNGKQIWIQASYNPIFDPSGKPFKVVKYATDTTAQVHARAEKNRIGGMVDQNLGSIANAVDNASRQTTNAATASTQAATTVQTIAAAAEELNSSIQEIAESMARSKSSVEKAMTLTEKADQSTQDLSKAANQMNGIVNIIQDIANQINLLALNATIESARAGEAGKGFAVVASEVKNLAGQVAQATDKISSEITGMQNVAGDVVTSLVSIKEAIESIEEGVSGVASAIEEQTAVTGQMSAHMQTASVACSEVDNNLKDILSSMDLSNLYTKEVQELSKELVS